MKNLQLILGMLTLLFCIGCSDDDGSAGNGTGPVADFSFSNDESTFTFTNLSENATDYQWDFGDLKFYSYEENPIYTYDIGGEITVSLTATNEAGESDFISKTITAPEIIIINIDIDGEFEDWTDVAIAAENTSGTGSIQRMKVWAGGENVNVYFEGNTSMQMELVDMFINSDGDPATGFLHGTWPENSGAEFLFEGPLVSNGWGSFYAHADPAGGWAWNAIAGSAANLTSSGIVALDEETNAIEFQIPKTQFGTLGESFGIAITEMTAGWALVANFPEGGSFVIIEP